MTPAYNLLDEPWIGVRTLDGDTVELSIAEVFKQAENLSCLSNYLPTQDVSILRVLLAILQRSVVTKLYGDENPLEVWASMWHNGHPDFECVYDYLDKWHDRFFLFDEENPFMQVPDLEATNGSITEVKKIIADQPDGTALFTMASGAGLNKLSFAEAARWLVHVHAYDTSGIKTGVRGDPQAKRGKSYPIGTGWTGRLGGLFVEGDNFAKTLMLNLSLCDGRQIDELMDFLEDDLPVWERPTAPVGDAGRLPAGTCDLFTWQTRRVRLIAQDDAVIGLILTNGDKIESYNLDRMETMSGWRRNESMEKRLHIKPVYLPFQHSTSRAFWRGLTSILPKSDTTPGNPYEAAQVLFWASELSNEQGPKPLDENERVNIHATGISYNMKSTVITEIVDDSIRVSTFLLSPQGSVAAYMVCDCLDATDKAVGAYGQFARRISLASGSDSDQASSAANTARSEAYFELDALFRAWITSIDASSNLTESRFIWHRTAKDCLSRLGQALVAQADTKALLGRKVKEGGKMRWESTASAERAYQSSLNKALTYATSSSEEDKEG